VLNDLLGGHIPLSFNNIPESIGLAGKVRPLGMTTAQRWPTLPDMGEPASTSPEHAPAPLTASRQQLRS